MSSFAMTLEWEKVSGEEKVNSSSQARKSQNSNDKEMSSFAERM